MASAKDTTLALSNPYVSIIHSMWDIYEKAAHRFEVVEEVLDDRAVALV